MNPTLKTVGLFGLLGLLFVLVGDSLGGRGGAAFALALAVLFNLGAWLWSDRIVLGIYGAKEIPEGSMRDLHLMVEGLARAAGIPKPRLYLIEEAQPNAFATGRGPSRSAIAVTAGLLRTMDRAELEGVLAHEVAHIRNRDVLLMTIAGILAAAIAHMADMARWASIFGRRDGREGGHPLVHLAVILFAGLAAFLVKLAISRSREYVADSTAARLCGQPHGLASALAKLDRSTRLVPMAAAEPATAHMMIANPFAGGEGIAALFSTHPPIPERIRRLQELTA